ncbi:uncharacterized protein ACIBXB_008100 [Morphnus guianensis]
MLPWWFVVSTFCQGVGAFWVPSLPKTNIWLTIANLTNQSSTLCLAMANPDNSFSTCLVGVPLDNEAWPSPMGLPLQVTMGTGKVDNWDQIMPWLPGAIVEPQELELLGSVKMDYCVMFNYSSNHIKKGQIVNATLLAYRNASGWCNYTSPKHSKSSNTPIQLPPGVFLICGDRAWPGIPSRLQGGPCSLGRLTVLLPNNTQIWQHRRKHEKQKREIHHHAFEPECNDRVEFWSSSEIAAASILAPAVGVASALTNLRKLGCWLDKQSNLTSLALNGLLSDVDSIRHATLQNRAAIDFLLLAHGHGCEDLDGMCCMNLSDHSESVHKAIQTMKDQVRKVQVSDGLGWLDSLFTRWGIMGWIRDLLKMLGVVLLVLLVLLLIIPCILSCIGRMVQNAMAKVWIVQKQKEGFVGYLESNGHIVNNPGTMDLINL